MLNYALVSGKNCKSQELIRKIQSNASTEFQCVRNTNLVFKYCPGDNCEILCITN